MYVCVCVLMSDSSKSQNIFSITHSLTHKHKLTHIHIITVAYLMHLIAFNVWVCVFVYLVNQPKSHGHSVCWCFKKNRRFYRFGCWVYDEVVLSWEGDDRTSLMHFFKCVYMRGFWGRIMWHDADKYWQSLSLSRKKNEEQTNEVCGCEDL